MNQTPTFPEASPHGLELAAAHGDLKAGPKSLIGHRSMVVAALVTTCLIGAAGCGGSTDKTAQLRKTVSERARILCQSYRISCALKDANTGGNLQVLSGSRGGVKSAVAIGYGKVSDADVRKALNCATSTQSPGCGSGSFERASGVDVGYFYSLDDPRQPTHPANPNGVTALTALQQDLSKIGALGEEGDSGWDKWDANFRKLDTSPLAPCGPAASKSATGTDTRCLLP